MLSRDDLVARREIIDQSSDLGGLRSRLREQAEPLLARMPPLPKTKALLSVDGGICPTDGATLIFDPWSPSAHRCPRCHAVVTGERHDQNWARFQHLWLAERIAHLSAVGVFADDTGSVSRAVELLEWYGAHYHRFPNRDNVLGPSRLFFSTYLESLWVTNVMAGAFLLREGGLLGDEIEESVSRMADEAANLIGEYNEGFSNRQTWNNAALAAVAAWFEDEALAQASIEGPTGLIAHLGRGYGPDGMWYEGENYHLFALRGLLTGASWARLAGIDIGAEPPLADRLTLALQAPARTALPDTTFPARKDSRFGLSLAQPMYLECWEVGMAWVGSGDAETERFFTSWLAKLYRTPGQPAEPFESYLHEASLPEPSGMPRTRAELSWWMLLEMMPELPPDSGWEADSVFMEGQGLAVLRDDGRYLSLECGPYGGGHGHPDRLHLSLYADGTLWLPDFGTGSYVANTLAWYRSTLAHNAPRLDGLSQVPGEATCEAFDVADRWGWVRGRYGDMLRTVISGPAYVLDILEYGGPDRRVVELPYHFEGTMAFPSTLTWRPGALAGDHVTGVEECDCRADEPVVIEARVGERKLIAVFAFDGMMIRAAAPGRPPSGDTAEFVVIRADGSEVRFVTLLVSPHAGSAPTLRVAPGPIEVETQSGVDRHREVASGWGIEAGAEAIELGGLREAPPVAPTRLDLEPPMLIQATVPFVPDTPPLDGSLAGFEFSAPLGLDHEDQYRRSEEPYPGPEAFSATAYLNWNGDGLYLAVDVRKRDPYFRFGDAPPLLLDNEVDDIHSDGIQIYLQQDAGRQVFGLLAVPDTAAGASAGVVRFLGVGGVSIEAQSAEGRWQRTADGYCVTLRMTPTWWESVLGADRVRFDLIVNEMPPPPERLRRAGQLVWTGGGGWVWLRGDRQDPQRFGVLELLA